MILAGDIGGTNTRIALFSEDSGRLSLAREHTYQSRDHDGLDEIVNLFLTEQNVRADVACFGVAGPVLHGRVAPTNLAWAVDTRLLSRKLGIEALWVINDLEAHASGIGDLAPADLVAIKPGVSVDGNAALIAAGTGLGEAGIYWDGSQRHAFAGEGGHSDFAPRNELEIALHQYLLNKFGRVSCERILSGPGLKNVYDFLRDSAREEEPKWLSDELSQAPNPAAVISQHGLERSARICEQALDIFAAVYGAEAGNLALKLMAVGGVFLSGGIAAKILPKLKEPGFTQAFIAKGRIQPVMEQIPVKVITNDKVGLIGAARYALTRALLKSRAERWIPTL
jgi:glucokinase